MLFKVYLIEIYLLFQKSICLLNSLLLNLELIPELIATLHFFQCSLPINAFTLQANKQYFDITS